MTFKNDKNHFSSFLKGFQLPKIVSNLRVTAQKGHFALRISSVNATKSATNCGFGHIY